MLSKALLHSPLPAKQQNFGPITSRGLLGAVKDTTLLIILSLVMPKIDEHQSLILLLAVCHYLREMGSLVASGEAHFCKTAMHRYARLGHSLAFVGTTSLARAQTAQLL
jgi:hypothetical protein